MKILVTGGAGYIGSFMVKRLTKDNHKVIVIDSLERGHREKLDASIDLRVGNLLNKNFISSVLSSQKIDAIIHFAGFISMEESMRLPEIYFQNNTLATLNLIQVAVDNNINKIIFSSTAGVYGNPESVPISEEAKKSPENPYGESKLMVESILKWYNKIHGVSFAALRYFNACGASLEGDIGENHNPETHIIPKAIEAAINHTIFNLYGTDYRTKDGTCVRDYIHVIDLVEAHVMALQKLTNQSGAYYYNIGTGNGFSNKEIIDMVRKVSGSNFEVSIRPRRSGDADELIADPRKIITELNFKPRYSDLETIISTAWKWHNRSL